MTGKDNRDAGSAADAEPAPSYDATKAAGVGGLSWAEEGERTARPADSHGAPEAASPPPGPGPRSGPGSAAPGDPGTGAPRPTNAGTGTVDGAGRPSSDGARNGPGGAPTGDGAPSAPGGAPTGDGAPSTPGGAPTAPEAGEQAAAGGDDGADGAADSVSVEDLVVDLERVTAERDQYLDASRRLQAEFENYRKAVAKREADARARANESLVTEILPVLDACDGALASGATDVVPVRTSLLDALTKQGLVRIDETEAAFDPECHEAVMHEPDTDGEGPVVAEVMRAGYSWKGRVVRPAMVRVRG